MAPYNKIKRPMNELLIQYNNLGATQAQHVDM